MKKIITLCFTLLIGSQMMGQAQDLPLDTTAADTLANVKILNGQPRYMYLNGFNFDFNNSSKLSYVGHFNIYVPATKKADAMPETAKRAASKATKENKFGINVGLLKINYLTRDSLVVTQTDNVLDNPLDVLEVGDTYQKQFNRYATQTRVSTFSIYVQPLRKIGGKGAATFYVHGHLELLATKFETSTVIKNIQTQEITITTISDIPTNQELIPYLNRQNSTSVNLESGYFGAGMTFDFRFLDNCTLFLQGTAGATLNYAESTPAKDRTGNYFIETSKKSSAFYLIRSYFQYDTSKATQIVIGTDIRGNFPKQSPYYSVYLGLNIGLDSIFN